MQILYSYHSHAFVYWYRVGSMKMNELRQKSNEELMDMVRERQSRIDELHFLLHRGKVKNVKEIAALKKDIARVQTFFSLLRA